MSPKNSEYKKRHSFFILEDEDDELKRKYSAKLPDVIGYQKRFLSPTYKNQISSQEKNPSLVIKVLPAKLSPKTGKNQTQQIMYVGKLVLDGKEEDKSISLKKEYGDLYDQDGKIIDKIVEVNQIVKEWLPKNEEVISRHIVLSIGGKEDKTKSFAVTKLFLEETFKAKGYDYVFAGHYNSANDHYHVIIKKRNNLGKNLRLNKDDLFILRQKYAFYLEKVGIKRQVLARIDKKEVLKKVEEGEEVLKNNNNWYQAKLNKGNKENFNAYNYKANLTGRIEEELSLLKIKIYLEEKLNVTNNQNLLNRIRKNLKKDGLESVINSLKAVKQAQEKEEIRNIEGFIIKAVESCYMPKKEVIHTKKTIRVASIDDVETREKFGKEIRAHFRENKINLESVIESAFNNIGQKMRFGKNKEYEIRWYGDAGYVLNYKTGDILKWGKNSIQNIDNYKTIPVAEYEKKLEEDRKEFEKKQNESYKLISQKAEKMWSGLENLEDSKYLKNKGINHNDIYNIKNYKQNLVIPVQDIDGKIWSLQFIDDSGSKKFLKDGKKSGNFFILGSEEQVKNYNKEKEVYLAEGFSTASSINKAVNQAVIVCFDIGNIEEVLKNVSNKFPNKKYFIMSDNDLWKDENVGKNKAIELLEKYQNKIDISAILPQFTLAHKDEAPTDFNDLEQLEGLSAVKKQIENTSKMKISDLLKKDEESILRNLKRTIIDLTDKRDIKKEVDEAIKEIKGININFAEYINNKINSDEVRFGYVKSKNIELKNGVKL